MQYEEELSRYREDVETTGAYTSILLQELSEAKILAGLTAIEGPGVIVTLRDGADNVIHDSNLLIVLNELRDAGAEALSLNQQRIVATSEVRCAGSIVSVNNVRCGAPFIIQAIGDPQVLFSALFLNGGVVDSLEAWDIHVTVEMSDSIRIAEYGGDRRFQFAASIDEQTK